MLSILALEFLDPEKLLRSGSYLLLFAIIFAESGLLVGFFLPGDSLLFTAGAIAGGALVAKYPDFHLNIIVVCLGCFVAAVAGDQVGYLIGSKAGPKIFDRPDSRLFKREYVDKAEAFFETYGAKAIVLARFVPVVRTFVPTVAGVSRMNYERFLRFNMLGGLLWGALIPLLGYLFGQVKVVQENFELAILGIVGVSFLPIIIEVFRHWRARRKEQVAA